MGSTFPSADYEGRQEAEEELLKGNQILNNA